MLLHDVAHRSRGKAKAPAQGNRRGQRTTINPHNTEDTTPPMAAIWGACPELLGV